MIFHFQTWRQAGRRLLELGCGVGALPAMACGRMQPPCAITLSDYDPAALELAIVNLRTNGVTCEGSLLLDVTSPPRYATKSPGSLLSCALFSSACRDADSSCCWPCLSGWADGKLWQLVLAADVAFSSTIAAAVAHCAAAALADDGLLLLAHQERFSVRRLSVSQPSITRAAALVVADEIYPPSPVAASTPS